MLLHDQNTPPTTPMPANIPWRAGHPSPFALAAQLLPGTTAARVRFESHQTPGLWWPGAGLPSSVWSAAVMACDRAENLLTKTWLMDYRSRTQQLRSPRAETTWFGSSRLTLVVKPGFRFPSIDHALSAVSPSQGPDRCAFGEGTPKTIDAVLVWPNEGGDG